MRVTTRRMPALNRAIFLRILVGEKIGARRADAARRIGKTPRYRPARQRLMKGAASVACFFCCFIVFFSFGVCCGFFLLCFGG